MDRDTQILFEEAWEFAAKRVNAGKHAKDRIKFFLADGITKTFDISPMRNDLMKNEFLAMVLMALNNHPVEALLLVYEAWFLVPDEQVVLEEIGEYLRANPRPQNHPKRREGVNFYYESSDGVMLTSLAEIVTIKKNKRELAKLSTVTPVTIESRMSHFFHKAREYAKDYKNIFKDIFNRN